MLAHVIFTLLSQPDTTGSWAYSFGTFSEVREVSSKLNASDPCGSATSGTVFVGVGSNVDMSADI